MELTAHALRATRKWQLDFTLTDTGKDSNFKLKTEQKSISEAVVSFFFHTISLDCNFPEEFPVNLRWKNFRHNLDLLRFPQFVSAFQQGSPLSQAFRKYLSHRSKPGSEKRNNGKLLIPRYTNNLDILTNPN